MKNIHYKNYIILLVLIIMTVFLTFLLSNIYTSKNKLVSDFYEYSNKITVEEFDEYIIENSEVIIYISDKYDLTYKDFEKNFQKKLDNLALKNKLVFIDKSEIDKKFINKLSNDYKINLDIQRTPIIIVITDNVAIEQKYIDNKTEISTLINYEELKW